MVELQNDYHQNWLVRAVVECANVHAYIRSLLIGFLV